MRRRQFLSHAVFTGAVAPHLAARNYCPCLPQAPDAGGEAENPLAGVASGIKISGLKVFGVSLSPHSDRPYVFVKLGTNQGVVGWGEATLEGKAGAVLACVEDFREFLVGHDAMQVGTSLAIDVRAQLLSRLGRSSGLQFPASTKHSGTFEARCWA